MKIAIASGKGGTGKTTVATNLAYLLSKESMDIAFFDCDVEEPNAHFFLKPNISAEEKISIIVPEWNKKLCTRCASCQDVCEFKAFAYLNGKVITFPEMCHSCLSCILSCPEMAIEKKESEVGTLYKGMVGKIKYFSGKLKIGSIHSPHIIKKIKENILDDTISIIDAPPGCTCPTVEAVSDADYTILVTEPTPFGLNDLKLAVEMLIYLKIPFSVVINKYDIGNSDVENYCKQRNIDVLMSIPHDLKIAKYYSEGILFSEKMTEYKQSFLNLFNDIKTRISK